MTLAVNTALNPKTHSLTNSVNPATLILKVMTYLREAAIDGTVQQALQSRLRKKKGRNIQMRLQDVGHFPSTATSALPISDRMQLQFV